MHRQGAEFESRGHGLSPDGVGFFCDPNPPKHFLLLNGDGDGPLVLVNGDGLPFGFL